MAGAGFTVDVQGAARLRTAIARLRDTDIPGLLDNLGALTESQTRERIASGQEGPDGTAWPDWSPAYAATRHGNQSLLNSEGHLLDSLQYEVNGNQAVVGSNVLYAATHQYGDEDRGLPARPYLGFGSDDLRELQDELNDWANELIRRAL